MEPANVLCSICSRKQATTYCTCSCSGPLGQASLLCDDHVAEHFLKDKARMHQLLPIASLSERIGPGYEERLKARQDGIALGRIELEKNITRVDQCVTELTNKVQAMMNLLSEYWTAKNEELMQIKDSLQRCISDAIQEAENTLYSESPQLNNKLTELLRNFMSGSRVIQLFGYYIDGSPYPSDLDSICTVTEQLSEPWEIRLPVTSQNSIELYNLSTAATDSILQLPPSTFNEHTVLCQVDFNTVFSIGSQHLVIKCDFRDCSATWMQQTLRRRMSSGVIKYGNFIYVFGGIGEQTAEKYNLHTNSWTPLSQMYRPRSEFVPSLYQSVIYLLDVGSGLSPQSINPCPCYNCSKSEPSAAQISSSNIHIQRGSRNTRSISLSVTLSASSLVCEVFRIEFELFETLQVKLPSTATSSSALSFHDNGEVIILTASNQMYRWNMSSQEAVFTQSQFTPLQTANPNYQVQEYAGRGMERRRTETAKMIANCQPIAHERCYYWAKPMTHEICAFDLNTKEVTVKSVEEGF